MSGSLPGCGTVPFVADAARPYSPLLFRCRRGQAAAFHLFGSLHVGRPEFYPLPAAVQLALDNATSLALEIDVQKQWPGLVAAFRSHVRLADGISLADLLDESMLADVRQHFRYSAGDWNELLSMQPWWIANFRFTTENDKLNQASRLLGIERHLLGIAQERGMPIIELESVTEQVAGLASGSIEEQVQQFRVWFGVVQRRGGLMGHLLDAWWSGDLAAIARLKDELWGTSQHLSSLRSRVFSNRDRRMAHTLAQLEHDGQRPFVAVGAYHLAGEDSLVQRLRELGYQVSRVDTRVRHGREINASNRRPSTVV